MRVLLPTKGGHDLDGHGWDTVWDDRQAVVLVLGIEDLNARHGDNTGGDALVVLEVLDGLKTERDLGTSGDEGNLGVLVLKSDVTTLDGLLEGGALELWKVLAGEGEDRWGLVAGKGNVVGSRGLVTISWAPDHHVWQSTEVSEGLDRLVGWAILTKTDGVVGSDVDDALVREGGETDGTGGVGDEVEESTTSWDDGAVGRHTVHHGGHGVLAHTVAHVPSGPLTDTGGWWLEVNSGLPPGVVGASQVGGTGDELWNNVVDGLKNALGELPGGDSWVGWLVGWELVLPALWELAGQTAGKVGGEVLVLAGVLLEELVPLLLSSGTLRGVLVVHVVDLLRNNESLLWVETELLLDLQDVVLLQWVTVDTAGTLELGAVTDGGGKLDDGWLVLDLLGLLDGSLHALEVGVTLLDVLGVPAVGLKALQDVLSEGALGVTV